MRSKLSATCARISLQVAAAHPLSRCGAAPVDRYRLRPGATAILADAFTLHDPSQQGRLFRRFESTTIVRQGGEPVLIDRFDIRGDPIHFARHRAFGTLLLLAPRPAEQLEAWSLELSADLAGSDGLYAAASVLPSAIGIGLRLDARELRHLRAGVDRACALMRRKLL